MVQGYPLPVAALVRRARNAKSPKERHDTAFYAWEASIRIAAAAAPPDDTSSLEMPSLGQWVAALLVADVILDANAALASYALLTEIGHGKGSRPRSVGARRLLDAVPSYRNQVLGHGSVRSPEFYDRAAATLLAGLDACWERAVFLPADARLVWIESIEVTSERRRKLRALTLAGLASSILVLDRDDDDVVPQRIYLYHGDRLRSLHPWMLYQDADLRERVLFFNGRGRTSAFLDYVSGEVLKAKPLADAFPGIEREVDALFATRRLTRAATRVPADPDQFGDYRILGELGQGGMGIVYLARQESLGRYVALKMLPPSATEDATAVARFQREIRALSRCDHPNVIKILASGEAQGRLYYAMELIQGADLAQVARALASAPDFSEALSSASERVRSAKEQVFKHVPVMSRRTLRLDARDRDRTLAALFADAARGLQHLHEQGVIHRDLKPSNLMVTESDHRIVIMDLGLATVGDASRTLTRDKSTVIGTLRYLPPEQLQRGLLRLDARADVYSLGVTLYELLTDRPFHAGETEAELIHQVLHATPPAPRRVRASIPRDLSLIVAKATDKDPARRYVSAEAFAQDLDAFGRGQPVVARPPTFGYLMQLIVRRHRALAAVIALSIALVVGGTAWFIAQLDASRRVAEREAEIAREQRARADESRYAADMRVSQRAAEEGNYGAVRAALARYVPGPGDPDLRGFEWSYLVGQLAGDSRATFTGHGAEVRGVAFSPDGRTLATVGVDATLRLHDPHARRELRSVALDGPGALSVAFSPDGRSLAVATGNWSTPTVAGKVLVFDAATLELQLTLVGHTRAVNSVTFSPDGRLLASGAEDNTAMVWELARGEDQVPRKLAGHTIGLNVVAFAGARVLVGASGDGHLQAWDVTTGAILFDRVIDISGLPAMSVTTDGALVAAAARDGVVHVWDTATWTERACVRTAQGVINAVAFSADGRLLVTGGSNSTLVLWTTDGWTQRRLLKGHRDMVFATAFAPDGTALASGSTDTTVKLWDPRMETSRDQIVVEGSVTGLALAPDGRTVAVALGPAQIGRPAAPAPLALLVDVETRGRRLELTGHTGSLTGIAVSPTGERIATSSTDRTAILWEPLGRQVAVLGHGDAVAAVAFSPDGRTLATACRDQLIRLWDAGTGALLATLVGHGGGVRAVTFSPDGTLLASASSDRTVRLWDVAARTEVATLAGYHGAINAVAFSPDSAQLATGGKDRVVRVWSVAARRLEPGDARELRARDAAVNAIAYSPDGRTLAATTQDSTVALWNVVTGLEVGVLERHDGGVLSAAFSASGTVLVTGGNDHTIVVYKVASGEELAAFEDLSAGWSSP